MAAQGTIDVPTLAYVAAIIDVNAIVRTRMAKDTELPYVAASGNNEPMLRFLGGITGTKVTITRRSYHKAGCAQHCADKHQHVVSVSGRWSVSGAKATVLLHNIRPYIRLQLQDVLAAIEVGLTTNYKPATVTKMQELGWQVPEFGKREMP